MPIKIALAGNPNSGKTTMFNDLTGSSQHVGNWPGVTVEKKEGKLKGNKDVIIQDLPGIYSLSPYTMEEVVTRNYLIKEKPNAIINIVDASNIERNLYLTTQLAEIGVPMVLALNMIDIVKKNGDVIDCKKLSEILGCEIIETSALKKIGSKDIAAKAIEAAKVKAEFKPQHNFSVQVEKALDEIAALINIDVKNKDARLYAKKLFARDLEVLKELSIQSDLQQQIEKIISSCGKTPDQIAKALDEIAVLISDKIKNVNTRWFAIKFFERDKEVINEIALPADLQSKIEEIIKICETALDDDSESIITTERYNYIDTVIKKCVKHKNKNKLNVSDKIDKVVTNRILALPIFAVIIFLVYYISITTVGTWMTDWVNGSLFGSVEDGGFIPTAVSNFLLAVGVSASGWLYSLIINGIIAGVGAVLGFLPQMLVLFICLAFLEQCGYMARIAFILDRFFRRMGLSGKSFIPILVGTGCGVPGIMASRTIENDRDRRMTVMTTTFIPCGAKIPIIGLVSGALFADAAWVAASAYFLGMGAIILTGIMLKKTRLFAGDPAPFIMELPAYHIPRIKGLIRTMFERGMAFVKKAGTIVLLATVLIWFLMTFNWNMNMVADPNDSMLASIGGLIAPLFAPLGWGNWQAAVATVTGIVAKESVVAAYGVIYGLTEISENGVEYWPQFAASFTQLSAYSFLVFNLLCAPCFAAIGALRREMMSAKWTLFAVGYQCIFAYAVALIIYQMGMLFTGNGFGVGTFAALALIGLIIILLFKKPYKKKQALSDGSKK